MNNRAAPTTKANGKIPFYFRPMPTAVEGLGLPSTALILFTILIDESKRRGWRTRLCNAALAARLNRSVATVKRLLALLEDHGLIQREHIADGRVRTGTKITWEGARPIQVKQSPGAFTPPPITGNEDWNAPNLSEAERYQLYLCSRHWGVRREAVRRRAGDTCEHCKAAPMNHVHHKTYARKYDEPLEDLLAVCEPCHKFLHGRSDHNPAKAAEPAAIVPTFDPTFDPFVAFTVTC